MTPAPDRVEDLEMVVRALARRVDAAEKTIAQLSRLIQDHDYRPCSGKCKVHQMQDEASD